MKTLYSASEKAVHIFRFKVDSFCLWYHSLMRILVISDIHANLVAFETVLADAAGKWDKIYCLGDVIGYGPNPNECVELLREHEHICLTGNHDWAALGKLDIKDFNPEATKAVRWTQKMLTEQNRVFLDGIPPKRTEGDFTLVHASPSQPVWEYIGDVETAVANFPHFDTPYCLNGHTHVPILYAEDANGRGATAVNATYNHTIHLEGIRVFINPGSVGQPRDGDPRAAYGLLDTEAHTWEFHRVSYPIHKTQQQMRQAKLPEPLILRLEYGW